MKKLSKEEEYENDYAEYCRENEQNLKETFVNDNYLDEFDKFCRNDFDYDRQDLIETFVNDNYFDEFDKFCRNEFDYDRERTKEKLALKQKEL